MDAISLLLTRCGLHPDTADLQTLTQANLAQMRIGLYGGKSSIPMHPTYLTPSAALPQGVRVAVAACGETEIRTAQVSFDASGPALCPGESFPIPGLDYPAPLEDLIYGALTLLEPFLAESSHVALSLPFSLEYRPGGEVFLTRPPATLSLSDWEGVDLRAALCAGLTERGFGDRQVLPIGTVSAAHFSALVGAPGESRYLSLHWGASFLSGFAIPKNGILKLKSGENLLQLVDTGAGGFCGVPFGSIDLMADRDSKYPGEDLLDKMLSMHSLGEQVRFSMIEAVESGLLTFMCGRDFLSLRKLSLEAVLLLLTDPDGDHALANFCRHDAKDRQVALAVAQAVLDRALRLILAHLAAILRLCGAGISADAPALLSLSGAAFAQPYLMRHFEDLLQTELRDSLGLHCKVYHNPDCALVGAAVAAGAQA